MIARILIPRRAKGDEVLSMFLVLPNRQLAHDQVPNLAAIVPVSISRRERNTYILSNRQLIITLPPLALFELQDPDAGADPGEHSWDLNAFALVVGEDLGELGLR